MNDKKQVEKQTIEEMANDIAEAINHNSAVDIIRHGLICVNSEGVTRELYDDGYRKITRCKDCEHHHLEQEPCHGKTIHKCSVLNAEVFKDFYCYHGKPKTKGGAE